MSKSDYELYYDHLNTKASLYIEVMESRLIFLKEGELIVVSPFIRDKWCQLPYPGHKKGCPQFGARDKCPPKAPMIYDIMEPKVIVAMKLNLAKFAEEFKHRTKNTENWTFKARSSGYWWQAHARKELENRCRGVIEMLKPMIDHIDNPVFTVMPEANGVNVYSTCRKFGIVIVPRPTEFVWEVAVIGTKRGERKQ